VIEVAKLYEDCRQHIHLELLNQQVSLGALIRDAEIVVPGLLLAGFTTGFRSGRILIVGEPEVIFMKELEESGRAESVMPLLDRDTPCLVIAGALDGPDWMLDMATSKGIPIFRTPLSTSQTVQYLMSYLSTELGPETTINGTLVDVYGIGILLRGESGIGKSECALDLVQRGHRLVADDLVRVTAKPPGILIGRSAETLQDYVEVRGIGIVDIGSIYGIRAIRRQKRIEVEVNLKEWKQAYPYDRSGLDRGQTEILGVRITSITMPLVPGKSVSVIVEAVALSHILNVYGYDAPAALQERWTDRIKRSERSGFEPRDIE
jgi:HPr kinase/phosphorylase